ncbi:recombinase family protein [Shewanella atlantica]|uniref:recombinase family protein n=1 Tax=Shewanella atlantica TaxID=271099 RepID=UPI001C8B6E34|nr:recombinase family protein [Shewanella atlantica]
MKSQKVAYIRVLSQEKKVDSQLIGMVFDKIFVEEMSAKSAKNRPILAQCIDRPILAQCIDYVRTGDTLYVHSIDRLARSLLDLQSVISQITDKGATVCFHKEHHACNLLLSDRRHLLPSAALLGTLRATFTALGSSLHKGIV